MIAKYHIEEAQKFPEILEEEPEAATISGSGYVQGMVLWKKSK